MTREETKKAIEVMQAYVDGKETEWCSCASSDWEPVNKPSWNWNYNNYRIKSRFHYLPYDDVFEVQRDKWIRRKDSTILHPITAIGRDKKSCVRIDLTWYSLEQLCKDFVYEDGSPCGKVVEE